MKNKIFTGVICVFLLAVFIASPITYILSKNGTISVANVGNIIEVEKTYEDSFPGASFFNGIEEGKRTVNDIYINYVPGYVPITTFATDFNTKVNAGITDMLGEWGDQIVRDQLKKNDDPPKTPDDTKSPDDSAATTDTDTNTDDTAAVTEVAGGDVEYTYKVSYLSEDGVHRFYRIKATGSDGSEYDFYNRVPVNNPKTMLNRSKQQIKKINSMYESCPDVNLYVFIPTTVEDTDLGLEIFPAESTKEIFDNFLASLNENIGVDYIKIDSLEDRVGKYFISDHHWNRYGSYEGYCSIVSMMQKNYPDFGEAHPIVEDLDFDIPLHGSIALAVNSYEINDKFGVINMELPKHTLRINDEVPYGGSRPFESLLKNYKEGKYNKDKSYNHFIEFYRIASKIVYPDNNTGRNLLLIGDSFSPCITEAIASHFDTTVVRYVDSTKPENINYASWCHENNITDVLILETSTRVVLNQYNDALTRISTGG